MTLRKAVIPAAGHGTRMLPATKYIRKEFFPIVDRDGLVKPAIQMIVEEALASGIEEICLVTAPGGDAAFRAYFSGMPAAMRAALQGKPALEEAVEHLAASGRHIAYATQRVQDGYGDAVLCARDWAGGEPVLVMLGDHVYLSRSSRRCARQLIEAFERQQAPVSGVIRKPSSALAFFGTIAGKPLPGHPGLYAVRDIVEKPEAAYAARHLRIPGLPADTYLCFFGLHAMTPDVFDCLEALKAGGKRDRGEIQFTAGQAMLAARRPYFALEIDGEHYDIGAPEGYVRTVAAFGRPEGLSEALSSP